MDYVMLSALQHYAFCPRQCALIHVEQIWSDNVHTAQGIEMHKNAHSGIGRTMAGVRWSSDMELTSDRLGLHGRTDIVEFRQSDDGLWHPRPVEYKKGHPHKGNNADEIQLCGEALCLEEMTGFYIEDGDIYYGELHQRKNVKFTDELRYQTEEVAKSVHLLINNQMTPSAVKHQGCKSCSLKDYCLPKLDSNVAKRYIASLINEVSSNEADA